MLKQDAYYRQEVIKMIKQLIKDVYSFKALAIVVTALLLTEAVVTGLFPYSRGFLYEILTDKSGALWLAIGLFFANQFIFEVIQSVKKFLVIKLALRARKDRTEEILRDTIRIDDHVPQRLQEDTKLSYLMRLTVVSEYFVAILILIQLTIVNINVPLLLVAGFVYAGISVWIAMRFNPKLKSAEISEQKAEAAYRESYIESLNPAGIIGANKASLLAAFFRMQYDLFTRTQLSILVVLPYIVLGPMVLSGAITMGELVQHSTTFSLIVVNASLLIQYYTVWVKGTASELRVKELNEGHDDE